MTSLLSRRALVAASAAAIAMPACLRAAHAENSPVKLLLPLATGSTVDIIARAAQPALAKAFDAPVVIENQAGAGGLIGLQNLARSAPDGRTITMVSNSAVIFPSVIKSMPFDMPGDFTPIAIIGTLPLVLVVNPSRVAATNCKEFIALLKSTPDGLNFASGGTGTILHLATQQFLEEAGVAAKHIPYKGVGAMVTDLVGGQVEFGTSALASVQGYLQNGTLRAIGSYGTQRTPAAPQVPTFVEQGLPNLVVEAWFSVIGPKGMGAEQVRKVHGAFAAAFADPAVKEAMSRQGNMIDISSPERAAAVFRRDLAKYAALARKAGIEPQ